MDLKLINIFFLLSDLLPSFKLQKNVLKFCDSSIHVCLMRRFLPVVILLINYYIHLIVPKSDSSSMCMIV